MAAEYYERASRLDLAAECYAELGNLQRAARLFTSSGQREKAIDVYRKIIANNRESKNIDLDDEEVLLILATIL